MFYNKRFPQFVASAVKEGTNCTDEIFGSKRHIDEAWVLLKIVVRWKIYDKGMYCALYKTALFLDLKGLHVVCVSKPDIMVRYCSLLHHHVSNCNYAREVRPYASL